MKRLIPLLLLLCLSTVQTQAQHFPWQAIHPDRTTLYSDGVSFLHLRIDSALIGSYTSHYWNYTTIGIDSQPYFIYIDTFNWAGNDIIEHATSDYIFTNRAGQPITIELNGTQGSKWICYDLPGAGFIEAEVISMAKDTFLGLSDTIKVIRFMAKDSSNNTLPSAVNNKTIRLSREYGFLDVFRFVDFPQQGTVYHITGFTNPQTGFVNLTGMEIFDKKAGDEVHTVAMTWSDDNSYNKTSTVRITLSRTQLAPDSIRIVDSVYVSNVSKNGMSGVTLSSHNRGVQTMYLTPSTYPELNGLNQQSMVPTSKDTNQYYVLGYFAPPNPAPGLPPIRIKAKSSLYTDHTAGSTFWYNEDLHSIVFPTNWYYVEGIGGLFYHKNFGLSGADYHPVYYRNGTKTWGTPIPENIKLGTGQVAAVAHQVYPNPFHNSIRLQLDELKSGAALFTIFSTDGKATDTYQVQEAQVDINVAHLPPGLYFYTIQMPDGRSAHGKLCRQ